MLKLFKKLDAQSYRTPVEVTQFYISETDGAFPICPRCNTPFEIEYQAFCGYCGQNLGWHRYAKLITED